MKANGIDAGEKSVALVPVAEQVTVDIGESNIRINERELKDVCKKPIARFWREYKDNVYGKDGRQYIFIDNGAKILAVAHLDTVIDPTDKFNFNSYTRDGVRTIKCPTLDDRLGVYIITKLLPKILGAGWADILLTDHEEGGATTASEFLEEYPGRVYNWIVEFDRRGSSLSHEDDAVLYSYQTGGDIGEFRIALQDAGFKKIARGTFTDIATMEDLGVKGFNIGVGYFDNHTTKAYVQPVLTEYAVGNFVNFYMKNYHTKYKHEKSVYRSTHYGKSTCYQKGLYRTDAVIKRGGHVDGLFELGDIVQYLNVNTKYASQQFYYINDVCETATGFIVYDLVGIGGGWITSKVMEDRIERAVNVCYYCLARKKITFLYMDDYGPYYLCEMCATVVHENTFTCEECLSMFTPGGDNGDFGTLCNRCADAYNIRIGDVVVISIAKGKVNEVPFLVTAYADIKESDNLILWDGLYRYDNDRTGFPQSWLYAIDGGCTPERFKEEYEPLIPTW